MNTTKRRTIRGIAALTIAATATLSLTACGDRDTRDCRPAKAAVKIAPAPIVVRPPVIAPRPAPPKVYTPPKPVQPAAPKPVQPAPKDGGAPAFQPSSPAWWLPFLLGGQSGRGC